MAAFDDAARAELPRRPGRRRCHPDRVAPDDGLRGSGFPQHAPDCAELPRHPRSATARPGRRRRPSIPASGAWSSAGVRRSTRPHGRSRCLREAAALPVDTVAVATDGHRERRAGPHHARRRPAPLGAPISEMRARDPDDITRLRRLANAVLLASLPIAGCSLAVNVAGGLAERRRPFSLLRLTGVPLSTLRRVVAIEAARRRSSASSSPPGPASPPPRCSSGPSSTRPSTTRGRLRRPDPRGRGDVAGDHRVDPPPPRPHHQPRVGPPGLTSAAVPPLACWRGHIWTFVSPSRALQSLPQAPRGPRAALSVRPCSA